MRCQNLSRAAVAALPPVLLAALLLAPRPARAQATPAVGPVPAAAGPADASPATGAAPAAGTPAAAGTAGSTPATGGPAAPAAGASGAADGGGAEAAADQAAPAVVDPNANPYIPVVTVRRSGLVLGATAGLALTSVSGTRNKFSLRGDEQSSGLAVGYSYELFLGGALTDWFVFHLGGGASEATRGDLKVTGFNVLFGAEVWPLFYRGGFWQNLGVGLDFGTGSAKLVNKSDEFDVRAEGQGFSAVRANIFYDAPVVWRLNIGPIVSYEGRFTEIYTEHMVTLGARFVYYNGP